MGKKQQKKKCQKKMKNIILQTNENIMDEKTLTQAIVNAYQIIEEKKKSEETQNKKKTNKKAVNKKKCMKVLLILNVLFFPWKINKRFTINNKIYDSILVLLVSLILGGVGTIIWIVGLCAISYGIVMICQGATFNSFLGRIGLGILSITFGSLFIIAGDEFSEVSDSNRIYAYSACILSLISCVVAILSLIKQLPC